MNSIIRYTILTAMRDWLYLGILVLSLGSVFLSTFLGGTAVVEQGLMSMAYMGGSCRMIMAIGLILFVCFHVRRSFDNKEVELILTRPISRVSFVFAYYLAFAFLSFTMILPLMFLFLFLLKIGYVWGSYSGVLFWGLSFYFETLILIGFAFFASLILSSAVSAVLGTFAFYFLGRIFGFFLISINNPISLTHASYWGKFTEQILNIIGIFLPRLDMFAKSEWLTYGVMDYQQFLMFFITSAIYIPLLITMAVFDFVRKEF